MSVNATRLKRLIQNGHVENLVVHLTRLSDKFILSYFSYITKQKIAHLKGEFSARKNNF